MLGTQEQRTEGMKRQAQDLIEQAYNRGYKAGQENALAVDSDKYREQGMNIAWEAAKYCVNADEARQYNYAFDGRIAKEIFENYTASEAINKLRAYEEQKKLEEDEEIKVGDVIRDDDVEAVVTWCDGKNWNGFLLKMKNVGEVGQVYSCMSCNYWEKTGRHFPEIAEVLKKLQEGES